jgi:hypothetical protein
VCVERPSDQGRALLVDGDGAVLSTVLKYAGVDVADGCPTDGTAVLHFLVHSLDDFVGEISGVEVSDRRSQRPVEAPHAPGCIATEDSPRISGWRGTLLVSVVSGTVRPELSTT